MDVVLVQRQCWAVKTRFKNIGMSDGEVALANGVTLEVTKKGFRLTTKRPKTDSFTPWIDIYSPEHWETHKGRHTVALYMSGLQMFFNLKSRGDAKDLYKGIAKNLSKL